MTPSATAVRRGALALAATDVFALGITVWSGPLLSAAVGLLTQPEPSAASSGSSVVAVA